jgi:hypothetical protein
MDHHGSDHDPSEGKPVWLNGEDPTTSGDDHGPDETQQEGDGEHQETGHDHQLPEER